jgi:hypothetical protein
VTNNFLSAVQFPALQVLTGSVALKMITNKGLELPVPAIEWRGWTRRKRPNEKNSLFKLRNLSGTWCHAPRKLPKPVTQVNVPRRCNVFRTVGVVIDRTTNRTYPTLFHLITNCYVRRDKAHSWIEHLPVKHDKFSSTCCFNALKCVHHPVRFTKNIPHKKHRDTVPPTSPFRVISKR